jgi:glycosyltransferase involved in cell wall biosynthesis
MGAADARAVSIVEPRPRIALFTDTLADVNGVSRFIRAAAAHASNVHVFTSTRLECPRAANIHVVPPLVSRPMPGYATIDVVLPSPRDVHVAADRLGPEVVHVSTPGPVGLIGRRYAIKRGLPLVGTYHTDFPAYIEHLFDDVLMTRATSEYMRWFYGPFDLVLSRSSAFAPALAEVGIAGDRVASLRAGMDTEAFHPRHRDDGGEVWREIPGARSGSIKLLYAGRVSTEKNLAMLARIWPRIRGECGRRGVDAQLVVVGDGPFRAALERQLAGQDAVFAGFRQGRELSTLYASSDAFIFPSATDTLGQAVMEAQASGLPAMVSDRGGPSGVVMHERTGFVLPVPPARDAERLWCEAAVSLLTSPELRARLGASAREHLAPMTIAASLEHFVELHAGVAAQKHKPGHALARGPARR